MFFTYFIIMNNPVVNLLMTTDRLFVLVAVVVSSVVGMLWYSPKLFWTYFMKWMHFPVEMTQLTETQKKQLMGRNMIFETLSRVLYFMWIGQALAIAWWDDMLSGLVFGVVVWLLFVFSTQLSQVTRAMVDKRVVLVVSGKILFETLLATVIWFSFFH